MLPPSVCKRRGCAPSECNLDEAGPSVWPSAPPDCIITGAVRNVAKALLTESAKSQRWESAAALRSFVGSAQSCGLALRAAHLHMRSFHDVTPQEMRIRRTQLTSQATTPRGR